MAAVALLSGYKVLDFSSVGPASRCSRILADYGAEVIKVGPPPAKATAQIQPAFHSYGAGRGMKWLRVDLKQPAGRDALLCVLRTADVLIESFRPGVAERLGLGYEALREVNPGIVYCSTSGYGQTGPYAQWAGHDPNYLALGGFLACSSRRADGTPSLPGASVADAAGGGMHAAIAILAALLERGRSSRGTHLDVSATDGVLSLMSLNIDGYLATGEEPGPGADILTGRYACYDVYPARDGRFLAVAAIEPGFYANLCRALSLESWIPHQLDDARQDEIRAAFRDAFARRDRDEWIAELAPRDTCVSPVYTVPELVRDAHLAERGSFHSAVHAEHGALRQLAPILAGASREPQSRPLGADSGGDANELLRNAGLGDAEIERMRREGVVA